MRRGFTPIILRIRAASIMIAQPIALSVAPVAECQESRCPPSITTSSALSVPAISAMALYDVFPPGYVVLTIVDSSVTGVPSARIRAMRP